MRGEGNNKMAHALGKGHAIQRRNELNRITNGDISFDFVVETTTEKYLKNSKIRKFWCLLISVQKVFTIKET